MHLAAPENCKIRELPDAVAVQEPHKIIDAPDRPAIKRENDIALLKVRMGCSLVSDG